MRRYPIHYFLIAIQVGQEDVIPGLDTGEDDYISKPFDVLTLLSRIRAALRLKSLYDELAWTKFELSHYVSLPTLKMVKKTVSDEVVRTGETTDVTVLFSDIRGFTRIAEDMAPLFEFQKRRQLP